MPEPPLDLPLSSFGATGDATVTEEEVLDWKRQTTQDFRARMFPGNHFYLTAQRGRLHQCLVTDLGLPPARPPPAY